MFRIAKLVVISVGLLFGSLVLAVVAVIVFGGLEPTSGITSTSTPPLSVVSFDWAKAQYGSRIITGTVKNNSSKKYSYAQVQFNLYDKSGAQVGSTLANINNLDGNGTWKFEALVIEDRATRATLEGVSGF